uniref:Uncharacterized protein n=1 Tax=Anopheles christyi TaxID=43041 RepID=A0A182K8Q8_9DIPT
ANESGAYVVRYELVRKFQLLKEEFCVSKCIFEAFASALRASNLRAP